MFLKCISIYLFTAIILLSTVFANSFARSKSTYAKVLGILSLTLQIYLLGYLLEINSTTLQGMIFWNKLQYIGIPFFPALWLSISMFYTGKGKYLKGLGGVIVFFIPIVTFAARLTNDWHLLYYNSFELQQAFGMQLLLLEKGPWYYVQSGYVLFILVLCSWFYYQYDRKSTVYDKMQFRLILIAAMLPFVAIILILVNVGNVGIDYIALVLPPSILLINVALQRYHFLEIKYLAREKVFEDSMQGLVLLNQFYRVVDLNAASIQFFQWFHIHAMKEERLEHLLTEQQELLKCIVDSETKVFQVKVAQQDRYVQVSVRSIQGNEARAGNLLVFEDVTEREVLKRNLVEMASKDELSGLNNRRKFRECANDIYQRAQRYHEQVAVLMLDLDYFKKVNDAFGHMAGDAVIKEFSQLLLASFRETDIVGRIGGEEFAVIMLDTDEIKAYQKAEEFRQAVEEKRIYFEQQMIKVTVSIGIAELTKDTNSFDELMNRADNALYDAKHRGRNRTVVAF